MTAVTDRPTPSTSTRKLLPSKVVRARLSTAELVERLADEEGRTFISVLDRLVDAGLKATGHPGLPTDDDDD